MSEHQPLPVLEPSRLPYISRPIDNTALNAYDECERKYYYSMVLNRRRGGLTKSALAYGTTWHAIMQAHYTTGGDTAVIMQAAVESWEQHDNPDDHRTLERALSAYDGYIARWGDHDKEAKGWGHTVGYPDSPVVELAAEVWWEGALHPYTGKIDRIIEHQGLYYVEDHKTTSALGPTFFRQFDPSNQMMGYCWIAQQLTGLPIAGVRINAHGVLKTQNKFERSVIHYSPQRMAEWAENYNVRIEKINRSHEVYDQGIIAGLASEEHVLLQAFPHNFSACAAKYGQCTYTDVCTMPPHLRGRVLEADYEVLPWNPLEGETDAE